MSKEEEEYFILRLPEESAAEVHRLISAKKLKDRLKINMHNTEKTRQCKVTFDRAEFNGHLKDLPTITEVLKTKDDKVFCKLGDLCQMVVCTPKAKEETSGEDEVLWNHGITPPLKNVRRKRFRKTARKKTAQAALDPKDRVKREVQLLLKRDKDSRDQSGIEATWEEVYEGGRTDDVAQLSDLEGFGTPAPDLSKAGFGDSDDDDLEDDKISLASFATSATGISVGPDGARRASIAPSVASSTANTSAGAAAVANGNGAAAARPRPEAINMAAPDIVAEVEAEAASMDLDSLTTPGIFGGGPMSLDTPTGPSPGFQPFTEKPVAAPPTAVVDVAVAPAAPPVAAPAVVVDTSAPMEESNPVPIDPNPAPPQTTEPTNEALPQAAAMEVDVAPAPSSTAPDAESSAPPAPEAPAPAPEVPVVDEKVLELDRKIEELKKKIESQSNPNLKKRFALQLDKLMQQRKEAAGS